MLISSGERPYGGYEIDVNSVVEEKAVTKVKVVEKEPGKDEMTTQAEV